MLPLNGSARVVHNCEAPDGQPVVHAQSPKGDSSSFPCYAACMTNKRVPKPFRTPIATTDEAVARYRVMEDAVRRPRDGSVFLPELESALGMFMLAHYLGWKVPYLLHSKRTIKKYEDLLGLKLSECFPEFGPDADRTNAYKAIQTVSNFWRLVSGDEKLPEGLDKRLMDEQGT